MIDVVYVDSDRGVGEMVTELRTCERVALDAEGNGMHAYRTSLCLLQLCDASTAESASRVFIVDVLALKDLTALAPLVCHSQPQPVLHDVSFDARLLVEHGLRIGPVCDTSVFARFLGLRETGLAALLAARFDVRLDKRWQQHDWSKRPLTDEQLDYLCHDVAWLGPLAHALESEVAPLDIADEIRTETDYAIENACAAAPTEPGWMRLRGAGALTPVSRAVLASVFDTREAIALERDVPPGRVMSNADLVALARARPASLSELRRVANPNVHSRGRHEDLLRAVRAGETAFERSPDEPHWQPAAPPPAEERARRKRTEHALSEWRRKAATERGVDLQVVLPGHALNDIVARAPTSEDSLAEIPGLGRARLDRYGSAIVAVVATARA